MTAPVPDRHLGAGRCDVLHVITGLGTGGAELMLEKLLTTRSADGPAPVVLSLMNRGAVGERLVAAGIEVLTLESRRTIPGPAAFWRLLAVGRSLRPRVVQGWMYHGNVAATLIWLATGRQSALSWNIRHTPGKGSGDRLFTRLLIRVGALLSRWPHAIIYNAHASASVHAAMGYVRATETVIPNGFDLRRFAPSPEARESVRRELGLQPDAVLVGNIGRWHAVKDQPTFLRAAALSIVSARRDGRPLPHFLLAGRDADASNLQFVRLATDLALDGHVHALGDRRDIPRLMAALDVLVNSSRGEGFANVIGEAMASGVPAVVTDVGDSGYIVGETGRVVAAGDHPTLSRALDLLLALPAAERAHLGTRARERVESRFGLVAIVGEYERLYDRFRADAVPGAH